MVRFLTAGESHGEKLTGIIEGFPANIEIDINRVNKELTRRQLGYGRSARMAIEKDEIEVLSGLSKGKTTGNPISFTIKNRGRNIPLEEVFKPRPGHSDLVGLIKYNQEGARNILERASARETATRVGVGAFCKEFLRVFNIEIYSHVISLGRSKSEINYYNGLRMEAFDLVDSSPIRTVDKNFEKRAIGEIEGAKLDGNSLGGQVELIVKNLPLGLGSYVNWDRKLDGKISQSLMGIQGIKAVEFGQGTRSGSIDGASYQDEIFYEKGRGFLRRQNFAGGIEGGMSTGDDLVIRLTMKPIPTLKKGLATIDINTKQEAKTRYERSDITAVPACSVVAENVVAIVLMDEFLRVISGDFKEEIVERYNKYMEYVREK